jgi:hypothetical protein
VWRERKVLTNGLRLGVLCRDRWTWSARLVILVSMLIRRVGGEWREPSQTAYLNESELQGLLAGSPDLIPGTNEALVIVREFPVETGSIDLVGHSLRHG